MESLWGDKEMHWVIESFKSFENRIESFKSFENRLVMKKLSSLFLLLTFLEVVTIPVALAQTGIPTETLSFANGPLTPSGPIDASNATVTFSVGSTAFSGGMVISNVALSIHFSKVGNGTCPGPGGSRDWAEEIRFRLYAPDGTMVPLVRFNDYLGSNPDVGPVTVIFDDAAAFSVIGRPIEDGSFKPSSGAMADYDGQSPAGDWVLELSDQWLDDPLCFFDATLTITVTATIDASIEVHDAPDPVLAGQTLSYEVIVTGDSEYPVTGIDVTDTLAPEFEYWGNSGNCIFSGGTGPGGEDQLICSADEIQAGGVWSFQVYGRVPAAAVAADPDGAMVITNMAELRTDNLDSVPGNNSGAAPTLVLDSADMSVQKITNPGTTVLAGQTFTYTILVDNLGPSAARNVVIQDDILVSGEYALVAVIDDPNRNDTCVVARDESVTCHLLEALEPVGMTPGNGRWTIQIEVMALTPQTVGNVVTVYSEDPDGVAGPATATPDPQMNNNQASSFVEVTAVADLAITANATGQVQVDTQPGGTFVNQPNEVTAGGQLTYTIQVDNVGPSAAANVAMSQSFPNGLVPASVVSTQGTCTFDTDVACGLGVLESGAGATITVVVDVPPSFNTPGSLNSQSSVSTDTYDPNNANNLGQCQVALSRWADLSLTKTTSPDPVPACEPITFTLMTTNIGPSDSNDVTIEDSLPSGMVFASSSDCTCNSGLVICDVGALPAGQTRAVSFSTTFEPSAPTMLTNTAEVAAAVDDPYATNNVSTASVSKIPVPTASVSGDAAICIDEVTPIRADLTGTPPWLVTWSDGTQYTNLTETPLFHQVSPETDTTYTVTFLADTHCTGNAIGDATVTVAFLDVTTDPTRCQSQGLAPQIFEAFAICDLPPTEVEWTIPETGYSFGPDVNPIVLDPMPTHTTDYQVDVTDQTSRETVSRFVRLLVAVDPIYFDLNADGCNNVADIWTLCDAWRSEWPDLDDPSGDGMVNIIDFLYLNLDDPFPCTRNGR